MQVVNHQQRDTVRQTLIGIGGGLLLAFLAFGTARAAERHTRTQDAVEPLRRAVAIVDNADLKTQNLEASLDLLRQVMLRESRTASAVQPHHKQRY